MKALTTKLRNGLEVIAKADKKYGTYAVTYCNRTQANNRIAKLAADGVETYIWQSGPCFYIALTK